MATGFTPPTMNWNASDIPDDFNFLSSITTLYLMGHF